MKSLSIILLALVISGCATPSPENVVRIRLVEHETQLEVSRKCGNQPWVACTKPAQEPCEINIKRIPNRTYATNPAFRTLGKEVWRCLGGVEEYK